VVNQHPPVATEREVWGGSTANNSLLVATDICDRLLGIYFILAWSEMKSSRSPPALVQPKLSSPQVETRLLPEWMGGFGADNVHAELADN
jgi:hypothetical protein